MNPQMHLAGGDLFEISGLKIELVLIRGVICVDEMTQKAIIGKEDKLRRLFNEFTYLSDKKKLEQVKKILDRIGTIDAEIEGLSGTENQRDLSIKFHWGHNHIFGDEFKVDGRMGDRHLNLMAQFMVKNDLDMDYFRGKDVIDVGCWTGGTLLLLKALGAASSGCIWAN